MEEGGGLLFHTSAEYQIPLVFSHHRSPPFSRPGFHLTLIAGRLVLSLSLFLFSISPSLLLISLQELSPETWSAPRLLAGATLLFISCPERAQQSIFTGRALCLRGILLPALTIANVIFFLPTPQGWGN